MVIVGMESLDTIMWKRTCKNSKKALNRKSMWDNWSYWVLKVIKHQKWYWYINRKTKVNNKENLEK